MLPQSNVVVPSEFCHLFTDDSQSEADEKEDRFTHPKHSHSGLTPEQHDVKAVPNFAVSRWKLLL